MGGTPGIETGSGMGSGSGMDAMPGAGASSEMDKNYQMKENAETGKAESVAPVMESSVLESGEGCCPYLKYVVQENDTLGNLLADFNMEKEEFFRLNPTSNLFLQPGSIILLHKSQGNL